MILTIKSFAFIIPKYSNEYNFPSLTPLLCGNTVDAGHAGRTNSTRCPKKKCELLLLLHVVIHTFFWDTLYV